MVQREHDHVAARRRVQRGVDGIEIGVVETALAM